MNLTLSAFGATTDQTNSTTGARTVAAEFYEDLSQFGPVLSLYMSGLAKFTASPTQVPVIEAWASSIENDSSASGLLLGSLPLPSAGTGGASRAFDGRLIVTNPGVQRYITFTVRAGLNGGAAQTLNYRGLVLSIAGADNPSGCTSTTTTLYAMRQGAKELSDKVNDASISDDTWNTWVNQGVESLWSIVSTAYEDHFFKTFDFSLTGGATGNFLDTTTIPAADFRRVRFLEWMPGTNSRRRVPSFNFTEKDRRIGSYAGVPWCNVRRYRLMGMSIYIEPYEQAAGSYRLYYIPAHPTLATNCDALLPAINQWAEYPILFAALKGLGKEESDDSQWARRLSEIRGEIQETAANRTDGDPETIADVEGGNWSGGGTWG